MLNVSKVSFLQSLRITILRKKCYLIEHKVSYSFIMQYEIRPPHYERDMTALLIFNFWVLWFTPNMNIQINEEQETAQDVRNMKMNSIKNIGRLSHKTMAENVYDDHKPWLIFVTTDNKRRWTCIYHFSYLVFSASR